MSEESTTRDLVERIRVIWEAADRADFDAVLEVFAPDAVWEVRAGGVFQGVEAIRRLFEDYYGAYAELDAEAEEILDVGNGVVLAVNLQKARMVGSTAHVETREVFVYEWDDGEVVRVTMYRDIDEGRAAAERLAAERA
jgi:ketosteroid isomerase-like protein